MSYPDGWTPDSSYKYTAVSEQKPIYGVKFQIPFQTMVVFSTNLDPSDLADEAFLRRIQNKVFIEPVSPEAFDRIFHRVVTARNIPADHKAPEHLRELCLRDGRTELRACYPNDICNILNAISQYEKTSIQLNQDTLTRAVDLYFARTDPRMLPMA